MPPELVYAASTSLNLMVNDKIWFIIYFLLLVISEIGNTWNYCHPPPLLLGPEP